MRDQFIILLLSFVVFQAAIGVENTSKALKAESKTTTAPPSTTTVAPTTSPATTNTSKTPITTSTPAPVTSSTTPPSTTVTPSPKPKKKDFWVVTNGTNNCIIASMRIQLDIPYNDSTSKPAMAHVIVPEYSDGSGNCNYNNSTQMLGISWANNNWINFTFKAEMSNNTSALYKHFWISEIHASVTVDNKTFPNITGGVTQVELTNSTQQFLTPMGVSFSCAPVTNIPASETPEVANQTAYFSLSHVQIQAFRNSSDEKFSSAIFCENGNTPDLVPILVGCALVGLVIIVLGAYIYSRKRSQARGYLSM